MSVDPSISDDDWKWLRDRYGDFVLEEPAYARPLLEVRDTLNAFSGAEGRGEAVSVLRRRCLDRSRLA